MCYNWSLSDVKGHSHLSEDSHGTVKCAQNGPNVHLPVHTCTIIQAHCMCSIPHTHTEVWMLLLLAAVVGAVTQFVEPVVFGCYEEVPGQQGADAHQKENYVHQIVRVLWTVAHCQRNWWMFGQKRRRRTLFLALLILWYLVVAESTGNIGGVEAGLHWLRVVHFTGRIRESEDSGEKGKAEAADEQDRKCWKESCEGKEEKCMLKKKKKAKQSMSLHCMRGVWVMLTFTCASPGGKTVFSVEPLSGETSEL